MRVEASTGIGGGALGARLRTGRRCAATSAGGCITIQPVRVRRWDFGRPVMRPSRRSAPRRFRRAALWSCQACWRGVNERSFIVPHKKKERVPAWRKPGPSARRRRADRACARAGHARRRHRRGGRSGRPRCAITRKASQIGSQAASSHQAGSRNLVMRTIARAQERNQQQQAREQIQTDSNHRAPPQ